MEIYSEMEDETPTASDEIGAALVAVADKIIKSNEAIACILERAVTDSSKQDMLAQVISEGQRSNVEMMGMIESSIVEALNAAESKEVIFNAPKIVTQWEFRIVRNSSGDMTDIVASAKSIV
jgi:hypothetical protein